MAPKQRDKTANVTASTPGAAVESNGGEASLTAAALEEEKWRVCICMLVPDSVDDEVCIRALKQAVQKPLRRYFTLLSWEGTLQKIHNLGDPSVRKSKDAPAFYEVTEPAKAALDAGQELSVDLKAKLVKFQLMNIKSTDLERRAALQRMRERAAEVKVVHIPSAPDKGSAPPKAPGKGGKEKTTSDITIITKVTKLKRRGEEDPAKYIDDEPDDGPQHYVLITGFHQPRLIPALDSLGVFVSNVIRLSSDRKKSSDTPEDSGEEETSLPTSEVEEGEEAPKSGKQQELELFWTQLDAVLSSGGVGSKLHDVAKLDYRVEETLLQTDTPDTMETLGAGVFEGVACLLYNTLDYRRQHQHYLNSLRLIQVPLVSKPEPSVQPQVTTKVTRAAPPSAKKKQVVEETSVLSTDVDMRLYCDLLEDFPAEVVSVPLIIHCMLEQVAASKEELQAYSKQHCDVTECHPYTLSLSSVMDLPLTEEEKGVLIKKLMDKGYMKKCDDRHPIILYHHDERAKRLHQLSVTPRLDPASIEVSMMKKNLVWDRLMSGHNTSTSFFMTGSSEDCVELEDQKENTITTSELQKVLTEQFRDWTSTEHYDPNIFLQVFQEVMESYRCVDTFSSSHDNKIFIICHNPMSPQRSSRERWDVALHTDVRFRSYLEHVVQRISDWIKQEEEKREEEQKRETEILQTPSQSCLDKEIPEVPVVLEPYIRPGSLKAMKLEQGKAKEQEPAKKGKNDKGGKTVAKGKPEPEPPKDSKTQPPPPADRTETKTPASAGPQPDSVKKETEKPQEDTPPFIGYSMDGRLIQIEGEIQYLYPSDGGRISVNRAQYVEGSTQLTVCVEKDGHCFYMHVTEQQRTDSVTSDTQGEMERRVCFSAVLHNGIRLSYSQITLTTQREPTPKAAVGECESVSLSLNLFTPTGLQLCFRTEDAHQSTGGQAVLVRQTMPTTGPGEDRPTHAEFSRTITCQGTVIRAMRDGATEVLFADSTVSSSPDSGPVCVLVPCAIPQEEEDPDKHTPVESKDKKDKGKVSSESLPLEKKESLVKTGGSWTTTNPSGYRVSTLRGERVKVPPILSHCDTDPATHNVVISRDDQVVCVVRPDGTRVVHHADGTRITTTYKQRVPAQRSRSGSGRGSRVKLVKVERAGFAMVTVNCENRSCEVLLGDGTIIRAGAQGSYEVCPCDGGVLHIHGDGLTTYSSEPCKTGPEGDQPGQYVMCQSVDDLCRVTDAERVLYQINMDGQVSVTRSKLSPPITDYETGMPAANFDTHPPRLFVMSSDGSATELLSAQLVEEILKQADSDPSVTVIKESLADRRDVNTIVKAFSGDSRWVLPTRTGDNVSASHTFSLETPPTSQTVAAAAPLQSPHTLLLRQITHNPPLSEQTCAELQHKLLVYMNHALQREKLKDELFLNKPKTVEMNIRQTNILNLSHSFSEKARVPVETLHSVGAVSSRVQDKSLIADVREDKPSEQFELQEQRRQLHLQHISPDFHTDLQRMSHSLGQGINMEPFSRSLPPFPKGQAGEEQASFDSDDDDDDDDDKSFK